ncbi:MAG: hypothetical protein HYR94_08695 [Chloroflexi bacterium]|nr:hypothetical protein [Chloroflexota bacterium]
MTLWFPEGSVNTDVLATADYLAQKDLPAGISFPPNVVGLVITFGLWTNGVTLQQFTPSIVVNVRYQDSDVPPALSAQEEQLYLYMYNPATQSWMKLCSSVNIYENVVSAALSFPTPYEENGGSLLAIAANNTPPLEQGVDGQGMTNISVTGSPLSFQVLPEAIEAGSNFEITALPNVLDNRTVKLLSKPVDLKLCRIDHTLPFQNSFQLTGFAKPLKVEFEYDPDTLSRVGGKANLILVYLQGQQWVDVEASGSIVVRGDEAISFETDKLGTFGLASVN